MSRKSLALAMGTALAFLASVARAQPAPPKNRFHFCDESFSNCWPGRGYTVCEAYLNHLNAMPRSRPNNGCAAWIDPQRKDFTKPVWEFLPIAEHLEWIYTIEKEIPPHTELPFDAWRSDYLAQISSGAITPRLKRTRLKLRRGGAIEELIAYDDGRYENTGCKNDAPTYVASSGHGGFHMYVRTPNAPQPVQQLYGISMRRDLLLYKGRPYFLYQDADSEQWYVIISSISDLPFVLGPPPGYGGMPLCEITDYPTKTRSRSMP